MLAEPYESGPQLACRSIFPKIGFFQRSRFSKDRIQPKTCLLWNQFAINFADSEDSSFSRRLKRQLSNRVCHSGFLLIPHFILVEKETSGLKSGRSKYFGESPFRLLRFTHKVCRILRNGCKNVLRNSFIDKNSKKQPIREKRPIEVVKYSFKNHPISKYIDLRLFLESSPKISIATTH